MVVHCQNRAPLGDYTTTCDYSLAGMAPRSGSLYSPRCSTNRSIRGSCYHPRNSSSHVRTTGAGRAKDRPDYRNPGLVRRW